MRAVRRERWLDRDVLSYPVRPRSIVDMLATATADHGPRTAFVTPQATVSYAGFADLVEGATAALADAGLEAGDRVAVAMRNSLDLAVAAFACARGGFVLVGLNVRLSTSQWAYQLAHSRATLALAADEFLEPLTAAAAQAGMPASAVRRGRPLLLDRPLPWDDAAARPDESHTYAVVYTSGTTGRPKASRVVHRCSVHSALSYVDLLDLRPADRTAVLFGLYYITGLHAHVLPAMHVGAASVLVADAAGFAKLLAAERITWAYTVPSLWRKLLRDPRLEELTALRLGAAGGSPFPADVLAELRRRLPHTRWFDVYGLSETHSPATVLTPEADAAKRGSVGRALPCMEARVTDDAGRQVSPGEPGELLLRGSLVTAGYLDDEAATDAAIGDGWLRTGDIARMDADGYVWLLDRKKDMIDRGGHKVYSVECERVLREHPDVADAAVVAAVVAIPDRVAGEMVACVIVPTEGAAPTLASLRRHVRAGLADYAAPRRMELVDALPRNSTGKVRKLELRAWLAGDGPRPETEVAR